MHDLAPCVAVPFHAHICPTEACNTGGLCFESATTPRHTPSPQRRVFYFPSYTPSLSALIESRKASPQILDKPSLFLVAQPDDSQQCLPGVKGEIKVILKLEKQVAVTGLVSSEATPVSVVEGLSGSRFSHFVCHGELEAGKPFEVSLKLHSQGFASYAAGHCAMHYCGFRSVVGTMWEMSDTDGRDLAESFYKSLFSNEAAGVPYYERNAGALPDAIQKLRGISLERWVNFVHYGA